MEEKAIGTIEKLRVARFSAIDSAENLAEAERGLAVITANLVKALILEVGGEKGLGPNQAAREREILLHLEKSTAYQEVFRHQVEANRELQLIRAEIKTLEDQLKVLLALTRGGGGE